MSTAQAAVLENPFEEATVAFEALVDRLKGPETEGMSHAALEGLIQSEGTEVLRLLLQAHLDQRGDGDVGDSVVGGDGLIRERKRARTRRLVSIFGLVLVTRLIYGVRQGGADGLAPMDASLNLPVESYSHGLRRRVAGLAARCSFDETVGRGRRCRGSGERCHPLFWGSGARAAQGAVGRP